MKYSPLPPHMLQPCSRQGRLTEITYPVRVCVSEPLMKRALVYLPHGYDDKPDARYPVLYLMHGGGGDENEVFGGLEGTTALRHVLDHAIDEGHAQPMIVVAPTFTLAGVEAARRSIEVAVQLTHRFPAELRDDLIPAIDAGFRTIPDRRARAFSGFSMGAETTWSVMAEDLREIWCFVPLSGDWWSRGLKGGKDFPNETADDLVQRLRTSAISPDVCRVLAFTGDKDIAFEAMAPMVQALAERDFFTLGDSPSDGNLTWCLKENGWHTYDDCWEYLHLAMPHLFTK